MWVFFDWKIEDYQRFLEDAEIPAIARELALQEPPVRADPSPGTSLDELMAAPAAPVCSGTTTQRARSKHTTEPA